MPSSSSEPGSDGRGLNRRGDWLRLGLLLGMLAAGVVLVLFTPLGEYLDRERLVHQLEALSGHAWAPLVVILLYLPLCLLGIPASPLVFVGGFLFGAVWGTLWNLIGCVLGGGVTFVLARALGQDAVARLIGPGRIARLEPHLERHAFTGLFGIRFLPIPYTVVNVAAAVAGVRLVTFLAATTLGLIVPLGAMTWLGSALARTAAGEAGPGRLELILAGLAVAAVIAVPTWWFHRWRKSR